jgi:glyoxylate/hydroxypyruvate reductase A
LTAVLRHHREFDRFSRAQRRKEWSYAFPLGPAERRVGVLGLGELGRAVASTLSAQGFPVAGWSRTAKEAEGITCFAGEAGLKPFLARTDILVCLLPLTAATRGILAAATFAALPQGAFVINVGRGAHLVEADLLAALASGQLAGATLDVFDQEPLPAASPLWDHPNVLITPHVASYCDPRTAADGVADNLRRLAAGEPLLNVVDRSRGY